MVVFNKMPSEFVFKREGIYTFLNPYSYLHARKNIELYRQFDGVYADGQWLVYFLRLFNIKKTSRYSFDYSSIADEVFRKVCSLGMKVAVIGSTQAVNDSFCDFLSNRYPGIKVEFSRNGYFSDSELEDVLEGVKSKSIDFVLVGMGAPNQEAFLTQLKRSGWNGLGFTCGGFMHQTASKGSEYYPRWVDKYNLRFLYRIYDEPKLLKRYLIEYPKFAVLFFLDWLTN